MRAPEGGLPKFWKKQQNFILGKGVFTGKMPTFRQQKKFLQEKNFIFNLLFRAQSIAILFGDFCWAHFFWDTLSCLASVGWRLKMCSKIQSRSKGHFTREITLNNEYLSQFLPDRKVLCMTLEQLFEFFIKHPTFDSRRAICALLWWQNQLLVPSG